MASRELGEGTAPVGPEYEGCTHYKRKCALLAPCCGIFYPCRFCHDEVHELRQRDAKKIHKMDRHAVTVVKCMRCGMEQAPAQECAGCHVVMGAYFCGVCNLFDDVDKGQWHCDQCGICRVGGAGAFIHCDVCNACLKPGHDCVAGKLSGVCPVCYENLFDSRTPAITLQCGHTMHDKCQMDMLQANSYKCPLCSKSMVNMKRQWRSLDVEIALTPLPPPHDWQWERVLCHDCGKESDTLFHFVGMKCRSAGCGSYNTRRVGKAEREHPRETEEAAENARIAAELAGMGLNMADLIGRAGADEGEAGSDVEADEVDVGSEVGSDDAEDGLIVLDDDDEEDDDKDMSDAQSVTSDESVAHSTNTFQSAMGSEHEDTDAGVEHVHVEPVAVAAAAAEPEHTVEDASAQPVER